MKLNKKGVPISEFWIFYYLKVELILSLKNGERLHLGNPELRGSSMEGRRSP